MSKFEDGSYGSLTGIALIGKVLAGRCEMKYTRAAVGNGTIPDDMTPKTMTTPADYVMDCKIASITNPVDGECQVTVQIKSDDVETGFYATGIVLYAEDPDDGEVPYTYLVLENEPEWIRPASSIVGKLATFDLIAAVGDVDTVAAVIDPESIATVGGVKELIAQHEADADAHSDEIDELIAAHNADPNAHGGVLGSGVRTIDAEIASADWQENSEDTNGYAYYHDITDADTTAADVPFVTLSESSLRTAYEAGMCQTAAAYDGYIRLKCTERPSDAISAVCALYSQSGSGGGGGSSYTLPAATTSTLGGVIVGDGLSVADDGTTSVDSDAVSQEVIETAASSDEDAEEMLDEVFGNTDSTT